MAVSFQLALYGNLDLSRLHFTVIALTWQESRCLGCASTRSIGRRAIAFVLGRIFPGGQCPTAPWPLGQ